MTKQIPNEATLGKVLASLSSLDQNAIIYAAATQPLTPASLAAVAPERSRVREGLTYLLEVAIAQEVIHVWSEWRGGRIPTIPERVVAVAHYAAHDAYLPLE